MTAKEQAVLEVSVTGVDTAASQFISFQQTTTKTMSASEAAVTRSLNNMVSQFVGVAAAARAVQSVISSGVGFDQFVENTTMSFTVMMKSAEKAKAQMKDLYDFAVNSPLTFKETASSSKQLMAYGFAAEELIPTMKTLGSVAIATGHSLDDISYVYGTLKSQGKAYSRDLMQFGMRGIPIYEELAKVMGVNVTQIQKLASEGKIGFAEVETAFQNMTTGSGRFSGILEGYMATLTGKLSMLSDIGQQSMGTLMQSVTDQLKLFVDEMTKAISGKGFQSFIEDAGSALGVLAGVLAKVLEAVVALLPVLSTMIKVLALPAVVLAGIAIMSSLPGILMSIGAAASTLATGFVALNSQLIATTAAESAMAMGAATASTGIAALSSSLVALAVANPWLLALIAIAAVGGAVITIVNSAAKSARNSASETTRAQQLTTDYSTTYGTHKQSVSAEDVSKIAEQYKLTEGLTANILKNTGALSDDAWQQYINTKSANAALTEQEKIATGLKHVSTTIEQDQMAFLSNLTGKDASVYEDLSNVDLNALGAKGAKDYIAGFAETRAKEKDIFGFAYSTDQLKKSLEDEAKGLTSALENGSKVDGLFDTNYDETLRDRLAVVNKELDGMGKKAKKIKDANKDIWWAPIVKAASLTASALDDIDVSTAQTQEGVQKEYEKRLESYRVTLRDLSGQEERASVMAEINDLTDTYLQYQKDITREAAKQKAQSQFTTASSGSEAYWSNRQADQGNRLSAASDSSAVAGYKLSVGDLAGAIEAALKSISISLPAAASAGADQLTKGTEVGNVASSDMGLSSVVMQAVTSFTTMISSIENVSKVLNPFKTIFEEAKKLLEPLLNNALEPLVQILEQIGAVVGQLLSPITGVLKVISTVIYAALTPLIAALQIAGNAFSWLYDSVIVPVGNAFIGIVNAIISAINAVLGWAGVNIDYIDQLQTTTEALSGLSDAIDNQQDALSDTIDYLTNKINDAVDDQINSLQDLYENGAMTATDYSAQVKALNAQKIATDNLQVSAADQVLTGEDIYARLYELYAVKDAIDNTDNITDEEMSALLTSAGLSSTSLEAATQTAILNGMTAYGASFGTNSATATRVDTMAETLKKANEDGAASVVLAVSGLSTALKAANTIANTDISSTNTDTTSTTSTTSTKTDPVKLYTLEERYKHMMDANNFITDVVLAAGYLAASSTEESKSAYLSGQGFATGTSNVPYDMTAQIHQGEGIVPATFMDSIRSGELALTGGTNEGSGRNVIVNVTVQGSVQTEKDLATSIANSIYTQRSRGLLTV